MLFKVNLFESQVLLCENLIGFFEVTGVEDSLDGYIEIDAVAEYQKRLRETDQRQMVFRHKSKSLKLLPFDSVT